MKKTIGLIIFTIGILTVIAGIFVFDTYRNNMDMWKDAQTNPFIEVHMHGVDNPSGLIVEQKVMSISLLAGGALLFVAGLFIFSLDEGKSDSERLEEKNRKLRSDN